MNRERLKELGVAGLWLVGIFAAMFVTEIFAQWITGVPYNDADLERLAHERFDQ